jgi:hypothetical protein
MNCLHEDPDLTGLVLVRCETREEAGWGTSYNYVLYKTYVISHARGHNESHDMSESVVYTTGLLYHELLCSLF